jgi:hypothetical protein
MLPSRRYFRIARHSVEFETFAAFGRISLTDVRSAAADSA